MQITFGRQSFSISAHVRSYVKSNAAHSGSILGSTDAPFSDFTSPATRNFSRNHRHYNFSSFNRWYPSFASYLFFLAHPYSLQHLIYSPLSYFLCTANTSGLYPMPQCFPTRPRMRVRIQFFILPYLSDDPLVISLAAFTVVLLFFCCTLLPNPSTIHCKKNLLGLVYMRELQKA